MTNKMLRYVFAVTFVAGLACAEKHGKGDYVVVSQKEIKNSCQAYCDKAHVCDDEVVVADCVNDCKNRMGDCMADEQHDTVEDLKSCAADACDDFRFCTVGAGLQCTFGL